MPSRAQIAAVVAFALVLAGGAEARRDAPLRAERIGFVSVPRAAVQGKAARVVVRTPAGIHVCRLSVRYADRTSEFLGLAVAARGRATWTWRVNEVATPGRAR